MARQLNAQEIALLFDFYEHGDLDQLARSLNTDRPQLHEWAKVLGLKPRTHHTWTADDLQLIRDLYPTHSAKDVAAMIGVHHSQVHQRAKEMGVEKHPDFAKEMGRKHAEHPKAVAARYQKGRTPENRGKKMSPELYNKVKATMFKKGAKPQTWVPVGTVVVDGDGYQKEKVSDDRTKPSRFNWKFSHVKLWEEHNGPVPPKHMVRFKDGNKKNIVIGNLELISMKDNALRNSIHNLPPELKATAYALGQLKKTINRYGKQDGGPEGSPVRFDRTAEGQDNGRGNSERGERLGAHDPGERQSGDEVPGHARREQVEQ